MIGSSRREGTLGPESNRRLGEDRQWHYFDRRVSLSLKLLFPMIGATLLGTALFSYVVAAQTPLAWIVAAGFTLGVLEVALVTAFIEYGVLRRVRRIHRSVTELGSGGRRARLSEGMEPVGRDGP